MSDARPTRRPFTPRFDVDAVVPPAAELGHVHVLAAGGAGMSAVVRLLLDAGLEVSGSDARDSAVLDALRTQGATIHVGHDAAYVADADTLVVSSAVRDDNVELVAARAAGLRVLHRSQALASLMAGRRRVAVAGANGKTTTTAMLTSALLTAGADPSFAIGGELVGPEVNARLGEGDAFVVEADESDGSFLVYHPDVAVVTNVQPDHLDFYGTFEGVRAAYGLFAESIGTAHPEGSADAVAGLVVTSADDEGARRLAEERRRAGARVLTFGTGEDADLRLVDVVGEGLRGRARLVVRDAARGVDAPHGQALADLDGRTLEVAMPGTHNLLDAAAALLAACIGLDADPTAVLAGLADYRGTRRRFEAKGEVGGVRVVDDYAHNPAKVEAVVASGRQVCAPGRLVVCFQPHLYSRTRDFAPQFAAGLARADVLVLLDVYGAREDPMPGVSSALVSDEVRRLSAEEDHHCEVHDVVGLDAAAETLSGLVRPGDLVLTVGAGSVTTVGPVLLHALEARA
ncbi:UDP-N-acetylmuramate--L-alanine ligase [Mobilicoccus pelagius]|uniref:UDP-N-acetylmuramate--L-alanine ligase n=1 Tax=Mobilicoccus pelagius NBRC 104925 TaxID=1089455 RepID=H5UQG3_9MICO|nr:UDP-N-acetylmuramate--L-alanine ligase [Mobilicoccus pelagius]GAB47971.1 UDP-N-acetylmuramate--L-alanine ligase [Mobilicoccus pelagius NBRC 104925]